MNIDGTKSDIWTDLETQKIIQLVVEEGNMENLKSFAASI